MSRTDDRKTAVDAFLDLLLITPCGSCVADPQFGFVFNNLKFEIFNENEGVIYNSNDTDAMAADLYGKKVSGTSKSVNTFATELKQVIERYEKRLSEVSVSMTYLKGRKKIQVHVEGVLTEGGEPYRYDSHIDLWN
ncbi:hypothetical protein [Millionella massiliensis]|uniref:hypothetical protein n=1 Tax=Millionella massiliensis TaxID=1871023 RepID=UPI00115F9818|nr:hypothetical protein [Millionella massiliensis]